MKNKKNINPNETERIRSAFHAAVAPEALEIGEDRLYFPQSVLFPITVRGVGTPGMPMRPWTRLQARDFLAGTPQVYSIALQRELPDTLRSSLRVRRTIFEGMLMALAQKTGRRPSRAEQATDAALDETESRLAMGDSAFRASLIAGLYASRAREAEADGARRVLESRLRAKGFLSQRLVYIAERALEHFQPGGELFPGIHEPTLMLDEAIRLLPLPDRNVRPPNKSVYLGNATRDGRDIFFSPEYGLDPESIQPPHATTLLLGEMGSGKTSLMRLIKLQRLLQGRRIFSLDPEGENNELCKALGGQVIPAAQPINPQSCLLHPLEADSAGELLFAVRFLISALAGDTEIRPITQAVLHDIVQQRWLERPGETLPLSALTADLKQHTNDTAQVTALLRPYAHGGLWDGFFDRTHALLDHRLFDSTEIETGCPWWNFDLSSLREENKALVHALLTWFLYRMISVTAAPVDIYLDEGWRLMRSPTFSTLLDELGRRARKRGVGVFIATHLPEDLNSGVNALGLASMAFTGRLGPRQAEKFLEHLGTSPTESTNHAERIGRLPPHTFYAIPAGGRGSLFSMQVRIPPGWLHWWQQSGAAR